MQRPLWRSFGFRNSTLILAIGMSCGFNLPLAIAAERYADDDEETEAATIQQARCRPRNWRKWIQPNCDPSTECVNPYTGTLAPGGQEMAPGQLLAPGQTMPGQTAPEGSGYEPGAAPAESASLLNDANLEGFGVGNPNRFAASPGGYLDLAAPVTMFSERYDNAFDNNVPDRGEYFYAQCGCYRALGISPNAKGPAGINSSVNYQMLTSHIEYAFNSRFSTFVELPAEWVHFSGVATTPPGPAGNSPGNSTGFGDMHAGFKYALIAQPDQFLTFQLRTYIPTGDPTQGLGTGHVSLESGLLYYQRLNDRWIVQAEFKEFAPIDVSSYASNVLQYGAGLGYRLFQTERLVVTPTLESVGWTFLGGQELPANGPIFHSASGATIINIKPGVRIGLSDVDSPSGQQRHSVYFGWGHPITNQRLYQDIFRVEYRFLF
jgi:hypothetical protein